METAPNNPDSKNGLTPRKFFKFVGVAFLISILLLVIYLVMPIFTGNLDGGQTLATFVIAALMISVLLLFVGIIYWIIAFLIKK